MSTQKVYHLILNCTNHIDEYSHEYTESVSFDKCTNHIDEYSHEYTERISSSDPKLHKPKRVMLKDNRVYFQYFPSAFLKSVDRAIKKIKDTLRRTWEEHIKTYNPGEYFTKSNEMIHPWQWRHNGSDSVSNHQPRECLLSRLIRRRSKKTSKFRVTGLCAGNSPETGKFPAQWASYVENVSIWWRRHESF